MMRAREKNNDEKIVDDVFVIEDPDLLSNQCDRDSAVVQLRAPAILVSQ